MYRIKEASIIFQKQLIVHVDTHIYYPVLFTTGIWAHQKILKIVYVLTILALSILVKTMRIILSTILASTAQYLPTFGVKTILD